MSGKKLKFERSVNIRNKEAGYNYHLIDFYVAGIVLRGSEIKSLRQSKVNLTDAYCQIINGEVFVVNLLINPYEKASFNAPSAKADRKLLLKKVEIKKLEKALKDVGMTLVATRIFINDRGLAKLEIATARGKKLFDKRETIKTRDQEREMRREH